MKKIKRKSTRTASELMEELKNNPDFVSMRDRQEENRMLLDAELAKAESPLLEELQSIGLKIDSVYDLVNSPSSYTEAVPILLRHLDQDYPERIREGIIRALTVPFARGIATKRLIDEFKHLPNKTPGELKWLVGNALTQTLTEEYIDDVLEILHDPSHGHSRDMLPFALIKFKDVRPDLIRNLKSMKNDPDVSDAVKKALRGESPYSK